MFVVEAFRRLLRDDDHFLTLLRAEGAGHIANPISGNPLEPGQRNEPGQAQIPRRGHARL